jgi:hypothetical protein
VRRRERGELVSLDFGVQGADVIVSERLQDERVLSHRSSC